MFFIKTKPKCFKHKCTITTSRCVQVLLIKCTRLAISKSEHLYREHVRSVYHDEVKKTTKPFRQELCLGEVFRKISTFKVPRSKIKSIRMKWKKSETTKILATVGHLTEMT